MNIQFILPCLDFLKDSQKRLIMPNWCENTVDFTGPKEEIAKLHQAVETANLNNYVSPIPQELKDVNADTSSRPDLEKKYGHSDWYTWCLQNWGTKWAHCDKFVQSLQLSQVTPDCQPR